MPTIFMTAYGEIDQAVSLVREGAWDYLSKPFDIDVLVDRLIEIADEARPHARQPEAMASTAMKRVSDDAAQGGAIWTCRSRFWGKPGPARKSRRGPCTNPACARAQPFVAVNSGLLHSEMADSLLFGHERGAFTGAMGTHVGFVEEAGKGTLFLDEIGEMAPAMQVKLLRLLDQKTFRRLGASADLQFEGRVVCATNRDLRAMVERGEFREDLWYRINVVTATLPPLRERKDDIVPLIEGRLAAAAGQFGRPVPQLAPDVPAVALSYGWPGNIRELVNRVDRAVAMGESATIAAGDLFPDLGEEIGPPSPALETATLAEARNRAERDHIVAALKRNDSKIQPTADQLGISRTTLWERMKRFGIEPEG